MKRHGFTLVELMIGVIAAIVVLMIIAAIVFAIYAPSFIEEKTDRVHCQETTDTDEEFEKCLEKLEVK